MQKVNQETITLCPFWKLCSKGNECELALTENNRQQAGELGVKILRYVNKPKCFDKIIEVKDEEK